jgi:outer membrane protein TolC
VKVTAAKDGLSASLGFVGVSQTLVASGEAPVAFLAGGPSTTPLTLTASMTFSLSYGEADRQAANSLGLLADSQRLQKATLAVKRDLDVRLAYQDWIRAVEAGRQATRTLALSVEILTIVQARAKAGELSGPDVARAELDVAKAHLAVQTKAVDAERLLRNAALVAFYPLSDLKVSP